MAELALPRELRAIGRRAIDEAVARRAGTVEAEHVLLAILARPDAPASRALAAAGLDHPTLATALDAERQRSLRTAGIAPVSAIAIAATPRGEKPGWGASIRDVLRRADKPAAKDGRPGALELELVAAILRADLGTIPRALALARIDRVSLVRQLDSPAAK
jgi:ATP-dependent Clp protease ATP-binding subunit ClpA